MPTESEFEAALETVAGHINSLDVTLEHESPQPIVTYEDRDDEMYEFIGYRCSTEDTIFVVAGHPEFEFMSFLFFTSVTEFLKTGLVEEEAFEIVDEEGEEDASLEEAALQLLNDVDDHEMSALKANIHSSLKGDNHKINLETTDDEALDFLVVESKIFPYEDGFNIKEVNDAAVSIIDTGELAKNLIHSTIALVKPERDSEQYALQFNM